jgi:putative tryptophan/tyrosine transport system substrate-binding protein
MAALEGGPEALTAYRNGLAIAQRLTEFDRSNTLWQRDLSLSYDRIGDVLVPQGELDEALKACRDGLAIRERLAAADRSNTVWQHDLTASYARIGDMLVAEGKPDEALNAYRHYQAIAERLTAADRSNTEWQRDLSVSYEKVGNMLKAQGKLDEALKAYRDELAIAERLAAADKDHYDRLPALAAELVQRRVAVLAAPGSPAALPAKAATTVIPVVFMIASDPVALGLVASLNRPGGNLTGVAYLNDEIAPKRLGLLHEFLPTAKSIGLLVNPANPTAAAAQAKELQDAVDPLGLRLTVVNASNAIDLEEAFATLVRERVEALQLGVDPLFGNHIDQIVALATRNKIPTIYPWREFTAAGGLMNYGASIPDAFRQVGVYTGQILKGAMPADLPVQRPTELQFALNLKTAKALGLQVPDRLLALADEIFE